MSKVTVNKGSNQTPRNTDHRGYKHIGQSERLVSMIAGTTLATSAMRSRSIVSAALMLGVSAGLIHRGATGKCGFSKVISKTNKMLNNCCEEISDRVQTEKHDQVSEAGDESFPASDPPSFTPVTGESNHEASHMNK